MRKAWKHEYIQLLSSIILEIKSQQYHPSNEYVSYLINTLKKTYYISNKFQGDKINYAIFLLHEYIQNNNKKNIISVCDTLRFILYKLKLSSKKTTSINNPSGLMTKRQFINCYSSKIIAYLTKSFKTRYYSNCKNSLDYFCELANYIDKKKRINKYCLLIFKDLLKKISKNEIKITLLQFMYKKDIFDKECMKIFMQSLMYMKWNDDTPFSLTMDVSLILHLHPEYTYDDFYLDRRYLLQKICFYYNLEIPSLPTMKQHQTEVAVICYRYFPTIYNDAYDKLVAQYTNQFFNIGKSVHLFILCTNYIPSIDNIFITPTNTDAYIKHIESNQTGINNNIQITSYYTCNIYKRLQSFINDIIELRPSYIIDMSDDFCPQLFLIQQFFPVIYLPMRRYMSSSFFDRYITVSKDICISENAKYRSFPLNKIVELSLGNITPVHITKKYYRSDFGINDNDFVIITVGGRLNVEISFELVNAMCNLLIKEPSVRWITVGSPIKEFNIPLFHKFKSDNRIIILGYEKNLISLYKICNAYLQPNRPGGGASIREAMREGLPIIITDYPSDAIAYLCKDDITHGDYIDLMQYISYLIHNKTGYQRASERAKKKIEHFTPEYDARKIIILCEQTLNDTKLMKKNFHLS